MKPLYSEEYYRKYWDRFLVPVHGGHYINLEGELQTAMDQYRELGMPEEAIPIVEKMEAEKIAAKCRTLVFEELEVLKRVLSGKSSFGMSTERQEIHARHEFRTRFDFNCLQLADFRKKHNL